MIAIWSRLLSLSIFASLSHLKNALLCRFSWMLKQLLQSTSSTIAILSCMIFQPKNRHSLNCMQNAHSSRDHRCGRLLDISSIKKKKKAQWKGNTIDNQSHRNQVLNLHERSSYLLQQHYSVTLV